MQLKAIIVSFILLLSTLVTSQNVQIDLLKTKNNQIKIQPILHSSFILSYANKTIYVDPYGGGALYKDLKTPDIILITYIHSDHLNQKTLDSINTSKAIFIVPKAVAEKLPEKYHAKITILNNGQGVHRLGFYIEAVAMYNLPEKTNTKHPKGRGNGYILIIDNKRIYISGDTEDIPEMRMLQNIDIAFVCMNLPYTMSVNQAANAVLSFQPKIVYPFHYRGKEGFSDIKKFKNLISSKNKNIEVRLRNWYPKN